MVFDELIATMAIISNPLSSTIQSGQTGPVSWATKTLAIPVLASRSTVYEPNSGRSPVVCAHITRQSLPAKFRFPGCTMEALGPQQRKPKLASASCRRRRGSAEFGPNLNRLSQSHHP
jgi:hypothetical protein